MLTIEEVKNIAALARVGIREKEIGKYQKDISSILDYVRKLDEVDTEGIEPIGHITGRDNIARSDESREFGDLGRKDILTNAPELKDGCVKVRSVL
jgi:aspartyl-tRNA(Asn)/glutamyl-tRNA(Gln) amidotransferase subunit C